MNNFLIRATLGRSDFRKIFSLRPAIQEQYLSVNFFDILSDDCNGDIIRIDNKYATIKSYDGCVIFLRFWFFDGCIINYQNKNHFFAVVGLNSIASYCGIHIIDEEMNIAKYDKDLYSFAFDVLAEYAHGQIGSWYRQQMSEIIAAT